MYILKIPGILNLSKESITLTLNCFECHSKVQICQYAGIKIAPNNYFVAAFISLPRFTASRFDASFVLLSFFRFDNDAVSC